MKRYDLASPNLKSSRPLAPRTSAARHLTSTFVAYARRRKKPNEAATTVVVTRGPSNPTRTLTAATEIAQEVSDPIAAAVAGAVAVRRWTHMRQIVAERLPSESATIVRLPWQRTSSQLTAADALHRLRRAEKGTTASARESLVTETGTAKENVIVTVVTATVSGNETANVTATTTGRRGRAAMMIATTIARGGVGKRNVSGCTDAALIQVRMTGSPMATIDPLGHAVAVLKMKMTTLDANHEIPR